MASIILKKFSEPESLVSEEQITPLSYKEWIARNYGVDENSESDQYKKYLLSWYETNQNSGAKAELKEHYKDLLKKLSVVFGNDDDFRKLSTLNLDDDLQLKLALPHYVKKIKEIALYYRDRRESIKRAKLKYSMIGSLNAVETTFYEHILKAFSKKDYTLNVPSQEAWNSFPELSAINNGFSIRIEEIYDDADYFRIGGEGYTYPEGSESPLTYILEDILEKEYNTTNIEEVPLSAFQIPLDVDHQTSDLNFHSINIANTKYAGANRYLLSGGHYVDDVRNVTLPLIQGDNFFYWFSGEYYREAPDIHYSPIKINDLDWIGAGAIAGDTLSASDRVFVNYNGEVKGAWLSQINEVVVSDTMSINLKNNKAFKYPYPGIGISAEGFDWTGKQVKEYEFYNKAFFPDQTQRNKTLAELENLYWTDMDSISSVIPISIHDTTLIDSGAFAHKKFHMADKIVTRNETSDSVHDENENGIYNGELSVDWLYDFSNTQIPISAGENKIFWPFQVYNEDDDIILNKASADPIALRNIPIEKFSGAVAGTSPETSDMILKAASRCGEITEGAWLMGPPLSALYNNCEGGEPISSVGFGYLSGAVQPSLSFKVEPRSTSRFIWTGRGNINGETDISHSDFSSFHGHEHDSACPYRNMSDAERLSITSGLLEEDQWKRCDCQAIIYSPLGHTGSSYKDSSSIGDYIILDTGYPDIVSLDEWKGSDNLSWQESEDFGWFKLDDNQIDGSHGWGKGSWVTNTGKPFNLKTGMGYLYYRSGYSASCEKMEREGRSEPFFIMNQPLCDCSYIKCDCGDPIECRPQWRSARFRNGVWEDRGTISGMIMEPLSHYTYLHQDKYKYSTLIEEGEEYIDCGNSLNFLLNVELTGTRPYWAKGSFGNNSFTKNKGLMYGGESLQVIYDYLQVSQPAPSTLILSDDIYLEYQRNSECSTDCFVWNEPLTWTVKASEVEWKKIDVNNCVQSDILRHIQNIGCEKCISQQKKCVSCCDKEKECGCILEDCITTRVGVSASNEESDIVFYTNYDGSPLFVNYYAIDGFSLNFDIINTSNGLAPSGGIWLDEVFIDYNIPTSPWTNIPNISGSSISNFQSSNYLYTERDCGFFKPSKLGYTVVKLNDKKIELSNYLDRTLSSENIILDPLHYVSYPYSVTYINSDWMKHKSHCAGGNIKDAIKNQEFSPYQSFYETTTHNIFGIETQHDVTTPWIGPEKNQLDPSNIFSKSIQGEPSVYCGPNSWIANQPEISGTMVDWKMDLYGNQYGVYKDLTNINSIKEKSEEEGKLWVRDGIGKVGGVSKMLPRVIDSVVGDDLLVDALTGDGIIGIDMFYDILMFKTSSHILFEKINVDYNTGEIFSNESESFRFEIDSSDFGGTWLKEDSKDVCFGFFDGAYPKIYKISANTSKLSYIYNEEDSKFSFNSTLTEKSTPVFSYNSDKNMYNMSYHGLSGGTPVLAILNFTEGSSTNTLSAHDPVVVEVSDLGDKTLIKTTLYDNKLIMFFEEEGTTNQLYQISATN